MRMKAVSLLGRFLLLSAICIYVVGIGIADEPGWTPIIGPIEISDPGSYFLAGDILECGEPVCINITCSDVVIDGRTHLISGVFEDYTTGVSARAPIGEFLANVTVTNISVSGFADGISFTRIHGGAVSRNILTKNARGIALIETEDLLVDENNASGQVMYGMMNGAGLVIAQSHRNVFAHNTLNCNGLGNESEFGGHGILAGDFSSGNIFTSNTIHGNLESGIKLEMSCTGNHVSGNSIEGNHDGILILTGSDNNEIYENDVRDNREFGLVLSQTTGNLLRTNTVGGNRYNFFVKGLSRDQYLHDVDSSNTVEGKPVYYLVEETGRVIGQPDDPGTVYLVDCDTVQLRDLTLEKNGAGVFSWGSSHLVLENLTCRENGVGINFVSGCDSVLLSRVYCNENDGMGILISNGGNVTIEDSSASFNTMRGMLFHDCSAVHVSNSSASHNEGPGILQGTGIDVEGGRDITLEMTRTSHNRHHGIWFNGIEHLAIRDGVSDENNELGIVGINSEDILIQGMRVSGNVEAGIGIMGINDCIIFNNYFNNTQNVDMADPGATATEWNIHKTSGTNIVEGPFIGGNYWANPDGTGWSQVTPDRGDGFCNAAYVIDDNNVDNLPLHLRTKPPFYADFAANPVSGNPPLTVQFTDASDGNIMRYLYRFGDGFSSMSPDPAHTYRRPGNYTVSLTIWQMDGRTLLSKTTVKENYIRVEGAPGPDVRTNFSATPLSGTAPLQVAFTGTSTGSPILWKYSFGDGFMSTQQNPTHTYRRPGNYTVKLTVWTIRPDGKLATETVERGNYITVT
ncbi:MAG: PKD domain protein [Methanoregulaceae archaeon PtaB.Bin056]|nr:MAG: PKD domain protein [Methanoregulaceae archaeon PtaB.Bin056]